MSKLLINEYPMMLLPSLAQKIGHEQAIVLQQIQYWLDRHEEVGNERTFKDDRWWVYNTVEEWQRKQFVWWSIPTLKRILQTLEKMGLVLTRRFEESDWNQRKWYSIDYDAVAKLEDVNLEGWKLSRQDLIKKVSKITSNPCNSGTDQIDPIERINEIPSSIYRDYSRDYFINQVINQAHKAFPGTADRDAEFDQTDLPQEEISTTTSATGKTGSDSYTPRSNQKATPTTGLGDSNKNNDYAAFSPKKEKTSKGKARKVAFKYDTWGVIQFPEAKRYKLPSILAMRTMQFLLAKELECEFGIDKDGDVWISDPKMGDWMLEEEMFGGGSDREQGQLPLKKMVSILNSETSPSPLDIEWYNDTAKRYFEFWQFNCDRLGKDALPTIQRYGSIAHWLIKLQDEEFDIEFQEVDLEDVA